ncbi:MAG: hypothetical protein UR60_C0040G0005 [Candidatus Moranbacteria bacterium GW2011_GWF2_34_56]|nr:MAG: hypothetical protein UR51_C0010G0021 [Candidatus Moranbacteria bacterium GW2011_GWF1_34_10]KKP63786.1 MAG: hypothetical protein UR60_C0040G0005 [Candidatus Moranbacteria bacterium GW2011_GWF2_34_56]HBI17641.1 hypothetical protein [Candidatus Moranbacteria bacterium]
MLTSIGNFLVENGDITSIKVFSSAFIIVLLIVLLVALLKRLEFIMAWNKIRKSLIDIVNAEGLRVSNLLIEIAMISAKGDGDTGKKIGMILQQIIDIKDSPEFYTKVLKFMEGINDNNQEIKLNGDYARVRNSIELAIKLIKVVPQAALLGRNDLAEVRAYLDGSSDNPFEGNGFLTDFLILAEEVIEAKKNIARAIARIEKTLSDIKPQDAPFEDEKIVAH